MAVRICEVRLDGETDWKAFYLTSESLPEAQRKHRRLTELTANRILSRLRKRRWWTYDMIGVTCVWRFYGIVDHEVLDAKLKQTTEY